VTRSDVLDYLDSPRFARHAFNTVTGLLVALLIATGMAGCHTLLDDSRTNAPIEEVGE
jgi:hypothetical protein